MLRGLLLFFHVIALSLLSQSEILAQTPITWNGLSSSAWSADVNWDGGVVPLNSITANIANFNTAVYDNSTVFEPNAGTVDIAGITLGATNGVMTMNGTLLGIGANGISIATGAGAFTMATVTELKAAQSWLNNSTNVFLVSGNVGNATGLTIGGSGNTTVSSILSGMALVKSGAGTLILSGANDYTGTTEIQNGFLSARSNTALGLGTATVTVSNGGTLQLQGGISVAKPLVLNGQGVTSNGTMRNTSGTNSWTGDIIANTLLVRIVSETGTLNISGNVAITQAGANSLVLQGNGNGTISGVISGLGSLTKSSTGTGTWTLSGINTYSGLNTISNGRLSVSRTENLGASTAGLLFGGGTLQVTGTTLTSLSTLGHAVAYTTNTFVGLDIATTANTFFVDLPLSQGTGGFTKTGAGTLVFAVPNSYTGATAISGGVLNARVNGAFGTGTGSVTVANGASLHLQDTVTYSKALNLNGEGVAGATLNGVLRSISGVNEWSGGVTAVTTLARVTVESASVFTMSGSVSLPVSGINNIVLQGDGTGIISGPISGIGGLTRSTNGIGTWTLSGVNSYTGTTSVGNGVLLVNGSNTSTTAAFSVAGQSTAPVRAPILGGTGTIAGPVTVTTNGILRAGDANAVGTLTLSSGLTLTDTARWGVRITDGSTPGTNGSSTVGTLPNPTSNNFVEINGGTTSLNTNLRVLIDGAGANFTQDVPYSYVIARGTGLPPFSITTQSQFVSSGFSATNYSLVGTPEGTVLLNFTPVPEPLWLFSLSSLVAMIALRSRG